MRRTRGGVCLFARDQQSSTPGGRLCAGYLISVREMLPVKKELLEGWLHKKKSGTKVFSALAGGANKRWFNVRELQSSWGPELPAELALCYYKSQREKEPDGWIYLKDVTKISDDEKVFTLASPARTMTLEAQTRAEHRLWLQGLVHLCTLADLSDVQSDIMKPAASVARPVNTNPSSTSEKAAGGSRAEEKPSSFAVLRSIQLKEEGDGESDSNLDDTPRSGSISASSRSSSAKRDKPDRQDHRKTNFKPQTGANTASRMHGYIRKNADGSTPSAPHEEAADAKNEEIVGISAKSLYSPEQDALHSAGPFNHRSSSKQTPESPDAGFGPGSNIDDMETVELSTVSRRLASSMLRQRRVNMHRDNEGQNSKDDEEEGEQDDERPTPRLAQGKIAASKTDYVEEKPRQRVRRVVDQEDEEKRALELELEKLRASLLATDVSSTASGVASVRRAPNNAAADDTEDEAEKTIRDQESSSSAAAAAAAATIRVPTRPPPGPGPAIRYAVKEEQLHSKPPLPRSVINPDPNFVSENWDETAVSAIRVTPPRSSTAKSLVETVGVTPDKNWLEEDFDKT